MSLKASIARRRKVGLEGRSGILHKTGCRQDRRERNLIEVLLEKKERKSLLGIRDYIYLSKQVDGDIEDNSL